MAAGNQQFDNEAFAAGFVVAIGTALFESKLETIISRLHFPMLHAWVQWWPLLLIVAGVVLLFADRAPAARSCETKQSQFTDAQRGEQ
ncbi:MAG TPA: hypothetical protein VG649_10175 [Candidatus Angelobacter sp.]|jgi:hypothetical protein|nr:hypothetical protein [Candidatus Angelobacter sp.]